MSNKYHTVNTQVVNAWCGGELVTTLENDKGHVIEVRTPDSRIPEKNDEAIGNKIANRDYKDVTSE